MVIEYF